MSVHEIGCASLIDPNQMDKDSFIRKLDIPSQVNVLTDRIRSLQQGNNLAREIFLGNLEFCREFSFKFLL